MCQALEKTEGFVAEELVKVSAMLQCQLGLVPPLLLLMPLFSLGKSAIPSTYKCQSNGRIFLHLKLNPNEVKT